MIEVDIIGTDAMVEEVLESQDSALYEEEEQNFETLYSGLAGEIISTYTLNRDAKRYSGVEDQIIDSLRAYNGEYNKEDLARIEEEGGSTIFMNITATKCKTAKSWISDILKPAKEDPFSIEATPVSTLPREVIDKIEKSIEEEMKAIQESDTPSGNPQQAQVEKAQTTLKEMNQLRRDIQEAVKEEINKEAEFQLKHIEALIKDQLVEGNWDAALSDFIHDFVIFPTAFMKGPVVTRRSRLVWEGGVAVPVEDYIFENKRVNPLDIYPSPNATSINEGKLVEHVRYTSLKDITDLKGLPGYHNDAIDRVVETGDTGYQWLSTGIESEKARDEYRGNEFEANTNVIHGLHFFGPIKASLMKEWAGDSVDLGCSLSDTDIIEVEAILIGSEVIKCVINNDPLGRRPYYKASMLERPGSFWGRSLPNMMNDIQRMCNACARALSNNMSMAAGPQIELYIDRLADDGDIEDIYPRKIWQLMSDPTGSGAGRAINFYQPTSNAQELLKVYAEFEARADDVTGIPRYAYGNDNKAGYGNTASGLSMLLETSSKVIKDAIRNIDQGLIKPRVEAQFYYNLLRNPDLKYTGDINVVPKGSSTLTVRGAEALRRNEFLQITNNPVDQAIMGVEGRAEILRVMAQDLGMPRNIIPTALELRKQGKDQQAQRASMQQAEMQAKAQADAQKSQTSLQATTIQVEGQKEMNMAAQQVKLQDMQRKAQEKAIDQQIEMAKIEKDTQADEKKNLVKLKDTTIKEAAKNDRQNQEIGIKMKYGEGI